MNLGAMDADGLKVREFRYSESFQDLDLVADVLEHDRVAVLLVKAVQVHARVEVRVRQVEVEVVSG
jgi:hypothetical protein